MKCPNWGKILAAAALCAALCACSKPQDVLPDHTATPETSATVAPTAAVVQATATHAPTDTTVPTILPQTARCRAQLCGRHPVHWGFQHRALHHVRR